MARKDPKRAARYSMHGQSARASTIAPVPIEKWKLLTGSPPTSISIGSLFYHADEADPDWDRDHEADDEPKSEQTTSDDEQFNGVHSSAAPAGNIVTPGLHLEDLNMRLFRLNGSRAILYSIIGSNGLFGDGGTGKDLILFQLAIAMTSGCEWLGQPVKQGRVLYFPVEDDLKELRRRSDAIVRSMKHRISITHTRELLIVQCLARIRSWRISTAAKVWLSLLNST